MTSGSGTVALVGRPNVGKSTLFNRLCGRRDALVHDRPGLTRDRQYGQADCLDRVATVIDTGGFFDQSVVADRVNDQAQAAIQEADLILLLIDASEGMTPADDLLLDDLRKANKPLRIIANKIDGVKQAQRLALFSLDGLGFGEVQCVSATHGDGIARLRETIAPFLIRETPKFASDAIPVAVIGRPNVGKSTLINTMLDDERCIVSDTPGTTRDAIHIPFSRDGHNYVLIDTAGIRRHGRVTDSIEKFSVVKSLDAMRVARVALLMIDATEGIVEQDLHIVSYAIEAGTGLVLVVNKVDAIDFEQRQQLKQSLEHRLKFAEWIPIRQTSALNNRGVDALFPTLLRTHQSGKLQISTSAVNRILEKATRDHPPPSNRGRYIKIRYANKLKDFPPTLLVHGNRVESLPDSYVRFLTNRIREELKLVGMPVVIKMQNSSNPFADRKNELTRRQQQHRRRLIQHRKSVAKSRR